MNSQELRDLAAGQRELERRARVKYYQRHLFEFCVEILGYDKLSPTFHGPLLKRWDEIDMQRWKGERMNSLDLWPRDHIKTWCERARVIRYYMVDPTWTHVWWHAVEDKAEESIVAVGKQIQLNKELRRLMDPASLPAMNSKKFVTATSFALRTNRIGDAPSMRAYGSGSEATGGHSKGGTLDDPIGLNDVASATMPTKKRWYEATVCNVVRVSEGWINGIGTRWDRDDIYADWMKSPYWLTTRRACLETNGEPDYDGEPVYLTRQEIEKKRFEMGVVMFNLQMMNDPTSQEDLPWVRDKEQFVSIQEAKGAGTIVVISDPAPARTGSYDGRGEKFRMDGTKDDWATAVLKIRRNGDRYEVFLLDGRRSKEWNMPDGFDAMGDLARKWKSRHAAIDADGSVRNIYADEVRKSKARIGARYYLVDLAATRVSAAKQSYFAQLAASNDHGEFYICDSCNKDFADMFLDQARNWKSLPGGKNGLKYDDCANVVSMVFDPEIRKLAQQMNVQEEWSPYKEPDKIPVLGGTRYIPW